jgi:hypothetical protein
MTDSRWWKDFDALSRRRFPRGRASLTSGAVTAGWSTTWRSLAFDAFGVDPAAPAHPRLVRERVEHVAGLEQPQAMPPFDSAASDESARHPLPPGSGGAPRPPDSTACPMRAQIVVGLDLWPARALRPEV